MNFFDQSILHFLNRFSQKSFFFDSLLNFFVSDYFFKGGIVMAVFWFLWFDKTTDIEKNRRGVVIAIVSSFIAIFVGRCLELTLPFRTRPAYSANVSFVRPYRFGDYAIDNLSSFPSDHAVLFFAMATGVFLISKRAGIFTYLYVFFFICVPRMYFGLHYPTDILVGAIVGVTITLIVSVKRIFAPLLKKILQFSSSQPGLFYALFFLLSFEVATLFEEVRTLGTYLYKFLRTEI